MSDDAVVDLVAVKEEDEELIVSSVSQNISSSIPVRDSFIDLPPVVATREASAVSLPDNSTLPAGTWQWRVGSGLSVLDVGEAVGFGHVSATVLSDSHPEVIANLVAEYVTDTILRIDGYAKIDLRVSLKADLIIVLGEVECSHPAKSAIVHSDQFQMTLNASIREVLRDIRGVAEIVPSSLLPTQSPKSGSEKAGVLTPAQISPASPRLPESDFDTQAIDPVNAHIIIAITPDAPVVSTLVVRASASNEAEKAHRISHLIQGQISKESSSSRLAVETLIDPESGLVRLVSVTFASTRMEQAVSDLSNGLLSADNLKSLDPGFTDETIVCVKNHNALRAATASSDWAGKDWTNPKRFGPLLARQQALRLIHDEHATRSDVAITFSPLALSSNQLGILEVHLSTGGSGGKTADAILMDQVKERILAASLSDTKPYMFKDPQACFFALNQGGSTCNPEFMRKSL